MAEHSLSVHVGVFNRDDCWQDKWICRGHLDYDIKHESVRLNFLKLDEMEDKVICKTILRKDNPEFFVKVENKLFGHIDKFGTSVLDSNFISFGN